MSNSKTKRMDSESIHDELHRLAVEDGLINKALEAVRLARQKNNIELMEVLSKIKELQQVSCSQNKASLKASKKNTAASATCSNSAKNIDDPSIVNQTKLNLSVSQNMNVDEEEESEESD